MRNLLRPKAYFLAAFSGFLEVFHGCGVQKILVFDRSLCAWRHFLVLGRGHLVKRADLLVVLARESLVYEFLLAAARVARPGCLAVCKLSARVHLLRSIVEALLVLQTRGLSVGGGLGLVARRSFPVLGCLRPRTTLLSALRHGRRCVAGSHVVAEVATSGLLSTVRFCLLVVQRLLTGGTRHSCLEERASNRRVDPLVRVSGGRALLLR